MGRRWTLTGAAPDSGQPVVMYACQRWGLKYGDESYIGHKNKTRSRAIGTYKRSKSAAQVEDAADGGSSSNYKSAGDGDAQGFPEKKLGSWNSESVLPLGTASSLGSLPSSTDVSGSMVSSLHAGRTGALGDISSAPARPARPNLTPSRQGGPPPIPTSSSSSLSPSSSLSSVSQPNKGDQQNWSGGSGYRDSPRRQPPPIPNSPPFDPSQSAKPLGINPGLPWSSNSPSDTPRSQDSDSRDGVPFQEYSQHSRRPPPDPSSVDYDYSRKLSYPNHNAYNSPPANNTTNSPNSSSYYSSPTTSATSQENKLSPASASSLNSSPYQRVAAQAPPSHAEDTPPRTLPPRDYVRRESAPLRPVLHSHHSTDLAEQTKADDSSHAEKIRRKSESCMHLTPRSDQDNDIAGSSHSRQPSQEELDCDQKAKELAHELSDKEHKLSEVLRLDVNKKRMQYMDGLFSQPMELQTTTSSSSDRLTSGQPTTDTRSNTEALQDVSNTKRGSLPKEYWVSPPKAILEMELRRNEEVGKDLTRDINDPSALMKQKEELLDKLHKKLSVLKDAKLVLQQEILDNNQLGVQVCQLVESKCQSRSERDKFKTYIEDLEKIVRLLLNLSGQLARAENAVQALAINADPKLKKMTMDKRERLHSKHEEAKLLKDDIDKRSEQLSSLLRERLEESEFSDYSHYIKMKSKLTIELQEMEDKITLGGEQIQELKKSIPDYGSADSISHR